MYFNVYSDTGANLEGYLIPDGFSAKPKIMVKCGEATLGPFACDIFLPGPYGHKHHETGVVGFNLDEAKVPGLGSEIDVEISDAATGFVFYRRLSQERHLLKRVVRLETQLVPHQELDRSLKPYFQFFAAGAERYGAETVRQMLEIANQPSTYVSGRVMFKSVQPYFTPDTIRITSLRDPFYELALRLWSVSIFKRRRPSFFSERDEILFEPAMSHFADMNFQDPGSVKSKINSAPKDVLTLFQSPFVHQLVAANPADKVSSDGLASALDVLSQFHVFCPDETNEQLAVDIAELFQIDVFNIAFSPVRQPFLEFAEILRSIPLVEQVLENDLILYYFIRKANSRAKRASI